jgi:hypothetical protein
MRRVSDERSFQNVGTLVRCRRCGSVVGRVLRSPEPCYCFVALDERSIRTYQRSGMPSWLEEFSLTAYRIYTDDSNMRSAKRGYAVLVRPVPGGRFALGPNAGDPRLNSMYFAFFGRAASGR